MNCLRCQTQLAEKIYDRVPISSCDQCEGIWLDAGKLTPILRARDAQKFSPELIQKTLAMAHTGVPAAELAAKVPCPQCSAPMNAMNYNYNSGIILNVCPKGDGLWFDKDELAEVQIFMEHWDEEARKNAGNWSNLASEGERQAIAELDEDEAIAEKKLGPATSILSAVLYRFEKMTRKK